MRSASLVASADQARVWKNRADAREQCESLNRAPDALAQAWTVEPTKLDGTVRG